MFADANTYCKTCEVCQCTKINYSHTYVPLHPHPVPQEIGTRLAMDHKVVTRTTAEGNTAILVIVEAFSGYAHLIPVKDMTAVTTAQALVRYVIPTWGAGSWILYSEKGLVSSVLSSKKPMPF